MDKVWEMGGNKPTMVRLYRDDTPKIPRWFVFRWPYKAKLFEVISEPDAPSKFIYYLASSVIKVDIEDEGWDSGCDEIFGLHNICSAAGYDGTCNNNEMGTRLIGYQIIELEGRLGEK